MVIRRFQTGSRPTPQLRSFDSNGGVSSAAFSGFAWLVLQNVGGRGLGLVSQLVVAAVLLPADFGLIGLTSTVSAFGSLFVSFGIDSVLLQRHAAIRLWSGAAFWWTLALGLVGFLIVLAVSPFAAAAYKAPDLPLMAAIIGISTPLTALQTVPLAILRSRLAFRQLAAINTGEIICIQSLTILLALHGFGALSFAIPLPVSALLKSAAMFALTKPTLKRGLSRFWLFRLRFRDSASMFGINATQSLISQGDYIILGLLSTNLIVGFYYFAFRMAAQPISLMSNSLSSVLLPVLTRLRASPDKQGTSIIRAARLVGLVVIPLAFLQAACAPPAIHILFASKWDASIPIIQILSIALGIDVVNSIGAASIQSRGEFRLHFTYMISCLPIFVVLVFLGTWLYPGYGTALAVGLYYLTVSPGLTYIILRKSHIVLRDLAGIYLVPIFAATAATALALLIVHWFAITSNLIQIPIILLLGGTSYALLAMFFAREGVNELKAIVIAQLRRR